MKQQINTPSIEELANNPLSIPGDYNLDGFVTSTELNLYNTLQLLQKQADEGNTEAQELLANIKADISRQQHQAKSSVPKSYNDYYRNHSPYEPNIIGDLAVPLFVGYIAVRIFSEEILSPAYKRIKKKVISTYSNIRDKVLR